MHNTEKLIVENLIANETYCRKVLPYIDEKFFESEIAKKIKRCIVDHYITYKQFPDKDIVIIKCSDDRALSEKQAEELLEVVGGSKATDNTESLIDITEKYIKDRAVYLAITNAIDIYDGKLKNVSVTSIPDILTKALQVSFTGVGGHNYNKNWQERWKFYTDKVDKIPFGLDILNECTEGGTERKTLNAVLAGTGVGKSAFMCDLAVNYLRQNLNVMYFTFEMSENKIGKRIDSNMLNIAMDEFDHINFQVYEKKIMQSRKTHPGSLHIKEFPTSQATVLDLKNHLDELKQKESFFPDIIIVDYLTIMNSVRFKNGQVNSYTMYKALAEELRGLAVETNTCMWTGLQLNRGGFDSSDAGMTDIADSFGIPMSLDYMIAMITNDELKSLNQIMFKQEKSRYGDVDRHKTFVTGYDKTKMRFYSLSTAYESSDSTGVIKGKSFFS
jgi:replicative DNA helicase